MTKLYPLGLLFLTLPFFPAFSQSACVGKSNLLCAIPNLYGPGGLILPNQAGGTTQFASVFQTNFAATATQLTLLPLASPASGFVYEYDAQTGLYARTSQSLGPVLTERGETIGRHKFSFGATMQRFRFSKLDGADLHNLPAILLEAGATTLGPTTQFVSTRNSIDIKLNQFTIFGTFGLTNRIDISVAVPYHQIGFNVNSVATLPNPLNPAASIVREFSNNPQTSPGNPSNHSASGIGDVTVRLKSNMYRNEKMNFAILTDVRVPTGDAANFLGSGAVGIKPVAAFSVRAGWLTPHVNVGYQWNGSSILGGNPYLGNKGKLPGFAVYSVGSDLPVSKYVTLSADYLGQQLVNALRISTTSFTTPFGSFQTIVPMDKQFYNQSDAAVGIKISAMDHLLFTGNVIVALNEAGLRQKVTPLVAVSYVF